MGDGCYFTTNKLEPYMDHCGMSGKYGGVFEIDIPQKTFKDFVNIIEVNK